MDEKYCPSCGRTLPVSAFYTHKTSGKSGKAGTPTTYCKECSKRKSMSVYYTGTVKADVRTVNDIRKARLRKRIERDIQALHEIEIYYP